MDTQLLIGIWLGQALRVALGWATACLRERRLLAFDERQLPSLATVAALAAAGSFISAWLQDPALQPQQRFGIAIAVGFMAQVIFRDGLKGIDQPQPLRPPVTTPNPPRDVPKFGGDA